MFFFCRWKLSAPPKRLLCGTRFTPATLVEGGHNCSCGIHPGTRALCLKSVACRLSSRSQKCPSSS